MPAKTTVKVALVNNAAKDDSFSGDTYDWLGEDGSLHGDLNVLGNDPGSATLFSVSDTIPTGSGTMIAQTCDSFAVAHDGTTYSGKLAINPDGTINFDLSSMQGKIDSLAEGETITVDFYYTAKMANGVLSTAKVTVTITGENDAPEAAATKSVTTNEDTASAAVAIGATDAEGDTLSYAQKAGSEAAHGSVVFDQLLGTFIYTPDENYNGTDSFTILISDGNGGTTEQVVSVTVNAVADLSVSDSANSGDEDATINGNLGASTTSGGALTYELVTGVANGTLTLNPDGTYSYQGDPNYNGPDSFQVKVIDADAGEEQTVTVSLTVDPVTDLSVNDSSNSGDEDAAIAGNLGASTTSGGALTYELVTDVANGTLNLNPDGTYSYQGDPNYNGPDSFQVKVTDADAGEEQTVTVSLTVDPVTDLSVGDSSNSGNEDTAFGGNLGASTTSGGALTYELVTDVANGALTLNLDGSYSYQGDADYNGPDSFQVKVTDADAGEQQTVTVSLTVNPVNDAPTTTPVTLAAIGEDSGARLITQAELLANAGDVDGPSLAAIGLAVATGGGTLVDNLDGTWSYTPVLNDDTGVTFDYTVTDGSLTAAGSASLDITPVNDLAVIQAGGDSGSVTEDAVPNTVGGNLNTTDVDSLADSWTAVNSATATTYGSFTMTAAGVWTYALNNANPIVNALNTGSPSLADSFTVFTSDGQSKVVNITINGNSDVALLPTALSATTTGDPNDFDASGTPANGTPGSFPADTGNNTLYGGAGNDNINGGNGNDIIYGGSGNDDLNGNNDVDTLYGGSGEDLLQGSGAIDTLIGGWGADRLSGGGAADIFKFLSDADRGDYIDDFAAGEKIDVSGLNATHFSSGAEAFGLWSYGAGSTSVQGATLNGNVYAADTDGNAGTIEFWFVVNSATPALTGADFLF